MKIYEIGTGYTPIPAQMGAATEIVVEELTRSFIKLNQNVEIIDISDENRIENDLPITQVKVPSIFTKSDVSLGIMHKLKRVVYSVALAQKLRKILENSNEETVLHFHNQYNLFFFLKLVPERLRKKAKIAYTVHSYIWHGKWDEIEQTVKSRYFQEVYCMKNADMVFVLNEQTKVNLIEHLDVKAGNIILINNGVNTSVYSPLPDKKVLLKEKYNLKGKKVFIQVGSVCDRKNQLTSVKLLIPLMKQNENMCFCYAGGVISDEYQQLVINYAEKNDIKNQVIYFGELKPGKELNDFYNLADAMIFPSKAEGFSLVILEAMSAGIPVIIDENLRFDLSEKCLQFKDESEFLNIINTKILQEQEQKNLSEEVRKIIVSEFSWSEIAEFYLSSFRKHGEND